jgi:hypothetical protein
MTAFLCSYALVGDVRASKARMRRTISAARGFGAAFFLDAADFLAGMAFQSCFVQSIFSPMREARDSILASLW